MFSFFRRQAQEAGFSGYQFLLGSAAFLSSLPSVYAGANDFCFSYNANNYTLWLTSASHEIYSALKTACNFTDKPCLGHFVNQDDFGRGFMTGYHCELTYNGTADPCLLNSLNSNCPTGFGSSEDYIITVGASLVVLIAAGFAIRRAKKHITEKKRSALDVKLEKVEDTLASMSQTDEVTAFLNEISQFRENYSCRATREILTQPVRLLCHPDHIVNYDVVKQLHDDDSRCPCCRDEILKPFVKTMKVDESLRTEIIAKINQFEQRLVVLQQPKEAASLMEEGQAVAAQPVSARSHSTSPLLATSKASERAASLTTSRCSPLITRSTLSLRSVSSRSASSDIENEGKAYRAV